MCVCFDWRAPSARCYSYLIRCHYILVAFYIGPLLPIYYCHLDQLNIFSQIARIHVSPVNFSSSSALFYFGYNFLFALCFSCTHPFREARARERNVIKISTKEVENPIEIDFFFFACSAAACARLSCDRFS